MNATWVVIDEARDERSIWGPFADEGDADLWIERLLDEYEEDGEDQSDWITSERLLTPSKFHVPDMTHGSD